MPVIAIIVRQQTMRAIGTAPPTLAVAVGYAPVPGQMRFVFMSPDLYRPATTAELQGNPSYHFYPVDAKAETAERDAIAADFKVPVPGAQSTFTL